MASPNTGEDTFSSSEDETVIYTCRKCRGLDLTEDQLDEHRAQHIIEKRRQKERVSLGKQSSPTSATRRSGPSRNVKKKPSTKSKTQAGSSRNVKKKPGSKSKTQKIPNGQGSSTRHSTQSTAKDKEDAIRKEAEISQISQISNTISEVLHNVPKSLADSEPKFVVILSSALPSPPKTIRELNKEWEEFNTNVLLPLVVDRLGICSRVGTSFREQRISRPEPDPSTSNSEKTRIGLLGGSSFWTGNQIKSSRMGVLIIQSPSEYSGGRVSFGYPNCPRQQVELSASGSIWYAATYSDCEVEFLPVTTGLRILLIYDLIIPYGSQPVTIDRNGSVPRVILQEKTALLNSLLEEWIWKRKDSATVNEELQKIVFLLNELSADLNLEDSLMFGVLKDFAIAHSLTALSGQLWPMEGGKPHELSHLKLLSDSGNGNSLQRLLTKCEDLILTTPRNDCEIIPAFKVPVNSLQDFIHCKNSHNVILLIQSNEAETLKLLRCSFVKNPTMYSPVGEASFLDSYEAWKLEKGETQRMELIKWIKPYLAWPKSIPSRDENSSSFSTRLEKLFQAFLELDPGLFPNFASVFGANLIYEKRGVLLSCLLDVWKEGRLDWETVSNYLLQVVDITKHPGTGLKDIFKALVQLGESGESCHKIGILALSRPPSVDPVDEMEIGTLLKALLSLDKGIIGSLLTLFFAQYEPCLETHFPVLFPVMRASAKKLASHWKLVFNTFFKLLRRTDAAFDSNKSLDILDLLVVMMEKNSFKLEHKRTRCRRFAAELQTRFEKTLQLHYVPLDAISGGQVEFLIKFLTIAKRIPYTVPELLASRIPPPSAIKVLIGLTNADGILEEPWLSYTKQENGFLSKFQTFLEDKLNVELNGPEWREHKYYTPCGSPDCSTCPQVWNFVLSRRVSQEFQNLSDQRVQHVRNLFEDADSVEWDVGAVGVDNFNVIITKKPQSAKEQREELEYNKEMKICLEAKTSLDELVSILINSCLAGNDQFGGIDEKSAISILPVVVVVKEELMIEDSE